MTRILPIAAEMEHYYSSGTNLIFLHEFGMRRYAVIDKCKLKKYSRNRPAQLAAVQGP